MRFVGSGISHAVGPREERLLELSIGEALERVAGEKTFVVDHAQRVKLSYGRTAEMAKLIATGLQELGLKEGDRVGVWLANRWEWIVTQMACAVAGFILVTINPAYRSAELHYAGKLLGLRALVLQRSLKTSDYYAVLKDAGNIPTLEFVIEVGDSVREGSISFNKLLEKTRAGSSFKRPLIDPHDACNVQFTSGTTGHPKGATLSHHNILNNAAIFARQIKMSSSDVLICAPPLYHCFGCVIGVLAVLVSEATIVLTSESFTAEKCLDCIQEYGGTLLWGVPTMHLEVHTLYVSTRRWKIHTLRGGCMAGSPCPAPLMEKMINDMNMRDIVIAYGMTETSPISTCTALEDDNFHRCNTVGKVVAHTEIKIVDERTRQTVPIGVVGEFCSRGYLVMLGYWAQEAKTKECIDEDGWMSTGDLATMDDQGYVRIVGRSKDMIIRGGENIFPAEVESFLLKMAGVQDVQVIGVPDEKMGEEVCAWIRPKGADITLEQVQQFCKGKIAHFKVPKYVLNRHEFPMTVSGKVKKNEMREETAKLLKKNPLWSKL